MEADLTGVVLDGRYRVIEPISEGAMGVVYRAERLKLGRIVAIKVMHDQLPPELASRKRFETEATAMAKLEHPHCAAVIDVGIHENMPFVVMDYVAGDTLRDLVANGPLPLPRAVEIVRQVLSGLAHAHEQGIIHRDIKPANIVVSQKSGLGDHVKILDFGLAKITDAPNVTTGIVVGTPAYMAPEQIRGTVIDHRADLYAAGVLMFELLTGKKPFVSPKDDPIEICSMHLKHPPPSMQSMQPGIEYGELEAIVAKALSKKPEDRFSNAVEFATALDAVVPRRSTSPVIPIPTVATESGWTVAANSAPVPMAGIQTGPTTPTGAATGPTAAPSGPTSQPAASIFSGSASSSPAPASIAPSPASDPPTSAQASVSPPASIPPGPASQPPGASIPSGPASQPPGSIPPGPASEPPRPARTTKAPPTPFGSRSKPATLKPAYNANAALASAAAAADSVEQAQQPAPVPGLPANFDLSVAIPRGSPVGASEKGLSPAFDLSIAIPSPAIAATAIETTMLPAAAIEAPSTKGETKLGLGTVEKPPEPKPPAEEPDFEALLKPAADHNATAFFHGAPPAGPSPLDASDMPAVAEAVSLPERPPMRDVPVSRKQWQIVGIVIGSILVIAAIIGTCRGSGKSTPETKAEVTKPKVTAEPPLAEPPTNDVFTRASALIEDGKARSAIEPLVAARTEFPKDPRFSYLLGRAYFATRQESLGLKQFQETLELDGTYRADPELIKAVIAGFNRSVDYPIELGAFVREIGAPARPFLEETAAKHPTAKIRNRAKAELKKLP